MNARAAALLLVVVCLGLAMLLARGVIGAVPAGACFAIALAVLGVASRGFRKPAR